MSAIDIQCPIAGCCYSTGNVSEAVAIALLNTHAISHSNAQSSTKHIRGPKLDRPKVGSGISLEDWNVFQRRWDVYREGSGIDDDSAGAQLFECADDVLGNALLKMDPSITRRPIAEVIRKMKALAVVPVAIGVIRAELLELKQHRDEPFRSFAARVQGKGETCDFFTSVLCECGNQNSVDYTDNMVRDVLIAGIYDPDIRRNVLGVDGLINKPLNEVIAI